MGRLGLVIDDDIPSRKIYASLLKSMGFEAEEAGDGVQAMTLLREQQPQIVFLDLRLPRIDGIELLSYIYSSPHLNDTRVVIITAHRDYEEEVTLRNGDLYLVKPIAPSEIREVVSQTLAQ
jgi:two-component system response regulator YesN